MRIERSIDLSILVLALALALGKAGVALDPIASA
jgi:hypothetical protein